MEHVGQAVRPERVGRGGRDVAGRAGPPMEAEGSMAGQCADVHHALPLKRNSAGKSMKLSFCAVLTVNSDSSQEPAGPGGSDATTPLAADATGGPADGPTTKPTFGGGTTALTARPFSSPSRVEFGVGQPETAATTQPHTNSCVPVPLHLCNCASVCLCVYE